MRNRILLGFFVSAIGLVLFPSASYAYVGPGAGLSAIGAFLALIATVVVAIFGFIWYPAKRMFRKRKQLTAKKEDTVD